MFILKVPSVRCNLDKLAGALNELFFPNHRTKDKFKDLIFCTTSRNEYLAACALVKNFEL